MNTKYAEYPEWLARRVVLTVSILPGLFWVTNHWILGLLSLLFLAGLYFKNSTFMEYRNSGLWFSYWLISLIMIGSLLGLFIFLIPAHADIFKGLYILTVFISVFIKHHYSKNFDKNVKALVDI